MRRFRLAWFHLSDNRNVQGYRVNALLFTPPSRSKAIVYSPFIHREYYRVVPTQNSRLDWFSDENCRQLGISFSSSRDLSFVPVCNFAMGCYRRETRMFAIIVCFDNCDSSSIRGMGLWIIKRALRFDSPSLDEFILLPLPRNWS